MDGVIRQWSGAVIEQAEKAAGLAPGELIVIMTSVPEYDAGLVGRASFNDWCNAIEQLAAERVGTQAARELVSGWRAFRGELDPAVVELVAQVRQRVPVGLLSNAHDQLPADLALLGLSNAFDEVIGSAAVGLAKPDPRIFELAASAFGVTVSECFFVDDLAPNIEAAKAVGMDGVVFTSAAQLRVDLVARGLVAG
jgi:putative hydrolase of the HAD superfamily